MKRQRLHCIHKNPVRAGIVRGPQHYVYSSAIDYYGGKGPVELYMLRRLPVSQTLQSSVVRSRFARLRTVGYVRDALGNLLASYEEENGLYKCKEEYLYGSDRLGILNLNKTISDETNSSEYYTNTLGKREYELSDYIDNVNVTVKDLKIAENIDADIANDRYKVITLSANQYYSFGAVANTSGDKDYKFGFNGMEKENDISGNGNTYDFEFRMYNSRIGRFLSIDPLVSNFPYLSPYCFAENSPIRFIELEGKEIADSKQFELAQAMLDQLEGEVAASGYNDTKIPGLSRTAVIKELRAKLVNPSSANGVGAVNSGGWFCGTAADLVVAANYNPMAYVSTVWDLVTTLEAQPMGGDNATMKVPEWAKNSAIADASSDGVNVTDWILRTTLRTAENDYSMKGENLSTGNTLAQGTLPWEQNDQLKRLGIKVKSKSFYNGQTNADLRKIEKAVKGKYLPIVFEDHGLSGTRKDMPTTTIGKVDIYAGVHYIVITHFEMDDKTKTVSFKYVSYGKESKLVNLSYKDFKKGMRGYWIPKNRKNTGGQPARKP